jgi:hypothetical protein
MAFSQLTSKPGPGFVCKKLSCFKASNRPLVLFIDVALNKMTSLNSQSLIGINVERGGKKKKLKKSINVILQSQIITYYTQTRLTHLWHHSYK